MNYESIFALGLVPWRLCHIVDWCICMHLDASTRIILDADDQEWVCACYIRYSQYGNLFLGNFVKKLP
jgi:hypothetical protein